MKTLILSLGLLGLTGCAGAIKMENVAGTWSCPRIDGVCADIATLDSQLIGAGDYRGVGGPAPIANPNGVISVNDMAGASGMPLRAPDEVARIVFAPSVDASGHYHGARAVYAVMKTGEWLTGPGDATTTQTRSVRASDPEVNTSDPASVETAEIKYHPRFRRTVSRVSANVPASSLNVEIETSSSDGQ